MIKVKSRKTKKMRFLIVQAGIFQSWMDLRMEKLGVVFQTRAGQNLRVSRDKFFGTCKGHIEPQFASTWMQHLTLIRYQRKSEENVNIFCTKQYQEALQYR